MECQTKRNATPRVVVLGLASCFGCQLQITNAESHLLEIMGQMDLQYWQLASSAPEPEGDVDVVVIEGAVTTAESEELVKRWRARAGKVIAMGACAVCGGIPGMAARSLDALACDVYGETLPSACGSMVAPRPVGDVIDVDFEVRACPIEPLDFVAVLQHTIYGSNAAAQTDTMCGSCKRNEDGCLWREGKVCLGLVTTAGCNAKCVQLGRECNGCRGLSPNANLVAARAFADRTGVGAAKLDEALELFNLVSPMMAPATEGEE